MKLLKVGDVILNLDRFDLIVFENDSIRFGVVKGENVIGATFSTNYREASMDCMIVTEDDLKIIKDVLRGQSYETSISSGGK